MIAQSVFSLFQKICMCCEGIQMFLWRLFCDPVLTAQQETPRETKHFMELISYSN